MDYWNAIVGTSIGVISLYAAIRGGPYFTGRLTRLSDRKMPNWLGRLWFSVVGILMLYVGIRAFLKK